MRYQVTLRTKLIAALLLPLALTLVAGAISRTEQQARLGDIETSLARDNHVLELVTKCRDAFMRARRDERDFVINVRRFSFEEARSRYASLLRSELNEIRGLLIQIDTIDGYDPWRQSETVKMVAAIANFEASFLEMVELQGRLGDAATGLEGRLRSEARAIEGLVDSGRTPQLLADLLMIRRYEKDYIAGHANKYQLLLRDAVDRLGQDASTTLPKEAAGLQAHLRTYAGLFTEYVGVAEGIESRTVEYLTAANTTESALNALLVRENGEAAATLQQVQDYRRSGRNLVIAVSTFPAQWDPKLGIHVT